MAKFCLTLLCSPTLEEKLLDLLLEEASGNVFTSPPASSHGLHHAQMATEEQVLGRGAAMQVQIVVDDTQLNALVQRVREAFHGTGLRYWASPLALEGEIE
jgi:hypothetical protein